MKNMQTSLFLNIRHRLVRGVWWSLVHDHYQVPSPMMRQHLPKKGDHFLGTDSLLMQLKEEPTPAIDGGNRRNSSSLTSYLLLGRQSTRRPSFAQKRCQRNIGLVLKIQQSPVFPHGFADFRGLTLHPFLTDLLIHFKVLTFRLLIGEPGFSQASPDRVMRNRR